MIEQRSLVDVFALYVQLIIIALDVEEPLYWHVGKLSIGYSFILTYFRHLVFHFLISAQFLDHFYADVKLILNFFVLVIIAIMSVV